MTYTYDEKIFSDLYKDAYGSRPRDHVFYDADTTPEMKQKIWDQTCDDLSAEMREEERREQQAFDQFVDYIQSMFDAGAPDYDTALRWIFDAEDFSEFDLQYGASYVCYNFGLNYGDAEIFGFQDCILGVTQWAAA